MPLFQYFSFKIDGFTAMPYVQILKGFALAQTQNTSPKEKLLAKALH